jgi:plastocyanin
MRLVVVLSVALAFAAGSLAGAQTAEAKSTKKCHWVKATKKRKRHKVCVKVKAKSKTTNKVAVGGGGEGTTSAGGDTGTVGGDASPSGPPAPATQAPSGDPAAPPAAPSAARVQATAREFSLVLSRATISAGALTLELVNRGEDPHDLHVRPAAGGADLLAIATTDPFGGLGSSDGALPAGTYTLYCALPGHEAAGMHATLTVQ